MDSNNFAPIKEKYTILAVDDSKTNLNILLDLLSDDYDVIPVLSGEQAIEVTNDFKISLILLDISMPGMDGYEVCQYLKTQTQTKDIPVLFITAHIDEESIVKGFKVGGVDYVKKPFLPLELLARIQTHLKLNESLKSLEYLATRDSMTGVLNRRKFFSLGEEKFKHERKDLYAVMIDIDKFKNINDHYGHPIGDEVIKLVASTIQMQVSNQAIFGRLGGEEFAILINLSSSEEGHHKMEAIRTLIESLYVEADNAEQVKFTISQGIAKVTDKTVSLNELLRNADNALYEAKNTGRNKSIFRD